MGSKNHWKHIPSAFPYPAHWALTEKYCPWVIDSVMDGLLRNSTLSEFMPLNMYQDLRGRKLVFSYPNEYISNTLNYQHINGLDAEIFPVLEKLNKANIITQYSCHGYWGNDFESHNKIPTPGYVRLASEVPEWVRKKISREGGTINNAEDGLTVIRAMGHFDSYNLGILLEKNRKLWEILSDWADSVQALECSFPNSCRTGATNSLSESRLD